VTDRKAIHLSAFFWTLLYGAGLTLGVASASPGCRTRYLGEQRESSYNPTLSRVAA
jgi:hypothetical protein